ncbi:histone-lysine N-methyltransferase PRDM9 isoform X3 [Oncorhynchus kisutch]|uniref:Histone-lysine N-methyltransferase PRDM9 n=1 Tax=Oncorhynchus kisutch TaxID=8019 RepID=A0A8C7D969_ONCKI|nr:histone-lysine N-methyltransferase PRDM9 isoform X3 [Oncorhynchus kisutch]
MESTVMSEEVIVVEWADPGVSEEGCQVQIITDNHSAVFSDSLVQNILVNTVVQGQEEGHQLLDDNGNDLYCEECHTSNKDQCDVQGGLSFMLDSPTPMGIPQRALLTLPHGLVVGRSSIPGAGLGVLNQGPAVAPGMHFGPCEGEVTTRERAVASDYSWEVWNSKSESEYIDAARDTHSNWMRYVNCARNEEEGNLIALQYRGIVFFHCCRSIPPGDEFLFWPGGRFIERFRDPSDQIWLRKCTPSEFRTDLSSQVFLCCQCQLTFTTKSYLQKHTEKSHSLDLSPASELSELDNHLSNGNVKADPMSSSSVGELAYRCPQCPKSFKQKGHVQRHMRNVHSKVKPYCCIHCRRCFAQLSCLARHQIRVHGKKKKQEIEEFMSEEVRGKSQPSPDRTQETESSTSDAPPTGTSVLFPCPHCPFSSTVESSLCQHMKSHDQREKVIKMQAFVEVRGESTHKPESPELPSDALHTEPQTDEPAQRGEEANSCSQCGKRFKQKGHFQRHMRAVHSNVRPYCCPQCRKCFAQGYDLARHQLRVHGTKKKRRVVEVRGANLPRPPSDSAWEPEPPSTNDSTTETQTGRAPSQRLRNLRVKSTRSSKAKTKTNAPKQRQISTKKRSHSDPDSDALDMEEKEMEGEAVGEEAQYSCTECQGTYDNPESLRSHQCIQVVVGPPPYSCSTCGVTFKRYTTLKKHKLNKHPKENLRYCCTRCGRFFSQAASLQRHLEAEVCKDIQLSSEAVPCSYCQFSFTEERYLRKHVKRHHPEEYVSQASGLGSGLIPPEQKAVEGGEVHLCFQCGKSYKYVKCFKSHRCFQSVTAKRYLCNDCGKGFSCFYSLKQHQRIHTGEKPYRCSYCEKCFSHSGQLNVHVRIHTGEKPFLCTECGETFRQSGDLKRHERKHTGVKPCTCPECGKSFSRPQSLKAHQLLHNGEKLYKCDQCVKRFSRNYHLTRHHEKMHS